MVGIWKWLRLNEVELTIKEYTKQLGVVLDSKLMWKLIVVQTVKKSSGTLYACKTIQKPTWGLSAHALVFHSGSQANIA